MQSPVGPHRSHALENDPATISIIDEETPAQRGCTSHPGHPACLQGYPHSNPQTLVIDHALQWCLPCHRAGWLRGCLYHPGVAVLYAKGAVSPPAAKSLEDSVVKFICQVVWETGSTKDVSGFNFSLLLPPSLSDTKPCTCCSLLFLKCHCKDALCQSFRKRWQFQCGWTCVKCGMMYLMNLKTK